MTLDEFEDIIKRKTSSEKGFNYFICFSLIAFAFYMLVAGTSNVRGLPSKLFFILLVLFILSISIYAIWVLNTRHKVKIWNNTLTKEQNIELFKWLLSELSRTPRPGADHINFFYKRYWLTLSFSVHLFADHNRIVVHADSTGYGQNGMIDLGASKRLENKILTMMKKQSAITHRSF